MEKILIAEDDEFIAELERDYLEAVGYEVQLCFDGAEAMKLAKDNDYSLILLDVMLPNENGFNICREIRKTKNTPVIIVSAKGEDVDKIRGLGLGADDYISKPFSPAELTARVKAHINIHKRLLAENPCEPLDTIDCGDLKIIAQHRRVIVNGTDAQLKNKEFELLLFLASNPNIVWSKDSLFERIWGMDALSDTATVTTHINRIREKIEPDPSEPKYIKTVWGVGYRFYKE